MIRVIGKTRAARLVFSVIYRRWLWDEYYQTHGDVLAVLGWRTARVCDVSADGRRMQVRCMTACFWIFQ